MGQAFRDSVASSFPAGRFSRCTWACTCACAGVPASAVERETWGRNKMRTTSGILREKVLRARLLCSADPCFGASRRHALIFSETFPGVNDKFIPPAPRMNAARTLGWR